jgi:hypothetical protein
VTEDQGSTPDPGDQTEVRTQEEQAFTGSVLIQLFDEDGQLKDERRGGGS